jgi:hypothetical protein
MDKLTKSIKRLKIGKTFYVHSESDRQQVLRIAKVLGVVIATRAIASNKFSCTRLPE